MGYTLHQMKIYFLMSKFFNELSQFLKFFALMTDK